MVARVGGRYLEDEARHLDAAHDARLENRKYSKSI